MICIRAWCHLSNFLKISIFSKGFYVFLNLTNLSIKLALTFYHISTPPTVYLLMEDEELD